MNIVSSVCRNKVLSIEQVECIIDSKENNANIESMHYQGYQDGIEITIKLSGEATTNCLIQGEGIVVSTTSKNVTVTVDNTSIIGGSTFEFDTKQNDASAETPEVIEKPKVDTATESTPSGNTRSGDVTVDAKKAIRGDFGNGAERRRQLGNDYEQVQALVNKMYRDGNLHW